VWPGDVLTCSWKASRRYEENGERRVHLERVCTKQDGGGAIEACAVFVAPPDGARISFV